MSCEGCVYYGRRRQLCLKNADGIPSAPCEFFDDVGKRYKERTAPFDEFVRTQGVYDDGEICDFCGYKKHTFQICEAERIAHIWDVCPSCLSENFDRI